MNAIRKTGFFMITVLLASGVLFASGCKEEEREYEINPSQLVSDVLENVTFAGEMQEVDKDALSITYTIEDGVEVAAYIAGGALSDEMIVFTAPDETTAQKTLENVKAHIEERSELFASYAPAEVAKLEKAYAIQKGKYVVVCVTEDIDNAKAVINQYF